MSLPRGVTPNAVTIVSDDAMVGDEITLTMPADNDEAYHPSLRLWDGDLQQDYEFRIAVTRSYAQRLKSARNLFHDLPCNI